MNKSRSLAYLAAGLVLATLAGCGGGGGGGGSPIAPVPPPVEYNGSASSAVISANNASQLASNIVASEETSTTILGLSTESASTTTGISGSGMVHLARHLNRSIRNTVLQGSTGQRVTSAAQVNEIEPCDGGMGSVRTSGTVSDADFTGTLAVDFNLCLIDGVTVNGPATLQVHHFELAMQMPTDFTLSFSRLTLRGSGLSIDAGGSLRWLLTGTGCCGVGVEFLRYTMTENLVSLNNNTNKTTKTENVVSMNEERLTTTSTSLTIQVAGRVFDPDHGYVDVTTPTPIFFGTLNQLFPDSGQLLLAGTNSTVLVTALNSTLVQMQLDTNGDGTVDNTARLKWTELIGPVGADLGDNDGDGMHNSWEMANGLNPGLNDAAGDKDGDGQTNLQEYLAGTTP